MNYAVKVASGDMVYIQSFIIIGSGVRQLLAGVTTMNTRTESVLFPLVE